jgi:hypothetical protein
VKRAKQILEGHCDCGGDWHLLGCLGSLAHYRCRHCGMQYSRDLAAKARRKREERLAQEEAE